ncbi:MAG: hypothetical protein KF718_10305 [Polyangiaceae bacterium]|nr:hypothetical protein [Polyangiaceae bacterium]
MKTEPPRGAAAASRLPPAPAARSAPTSPPLTFRYFLGDRRALEGGPERPARPAATFGDLSLALPAGTTSPARDPAALAPPAADGDPEREAPALGEHREPAPWVDPLQLTLCRPPGFAFAPPAAAAPPPPHGLPLEVLAEQLVRRIAIGGSARRGAARIELGAGALAGATVTVVAEAGEVSIELSLPPGAGAGDWEERLSARLRQRGVAVRELTVR